MRKNRFLSLFLLIPAALGGQDPVKRQGVRGAEAAPADSGHLVDRERGQLRRIPVTAEHLATAFHDDRARQLLLGARRTRLSHDSALQSYDATTYLRVSAGLALRAAGRERLAFRHENATRVRWQQGVGAYVEVKGARTVLPVLQTLGSVETDISKEMRSSVGGRLAGIPFYPGQETLWIGAGTAVAEVDERELVHPLATGSEAYYTYSGGDSVSYRLPQGTVIRLAELRVQPRDPRWNLAVGSFWLDAASHHLVRAAYRPAVEMDIWEVAKQDDPDVEEEVPPWLMPALSPMRGRIGVITVEYGLHEGRFWLPRLQTIEGEGEMSFMRIPFRIEERYQYTSVNAAVSPPPPRHATGTAVPRQAQCDSSSIWTRMGPRHFNDNRDGGPLPSQRVVVASPCNATLLATAPELPPSIYDIGDEVFGSQDLIELQNMLDMNLQSGWSPRPIRLHYGLGDGLLRYNRIEGISPAVRATQFLGRGYMGDGVLRVGSADLQPNAELGISRSDGRRTLRLGAFRRLAAANDWGTPLGLGASVSSLLFARDEGFYYRTWGAELTAMGRGNPHLAWRAFAERQEDADVETQLSVAQLLNDARFQPNIDASAGTIVGAEARIVHSLGEDPRGFRTFTTLRAESGAGSFTYTRALADVTVSRAIFSRLEGALTLSAGGTTQGSPRQRWFHLGGSQTIRGQQAGAMSGETFWMTRAELGTTLRFVRPALFADLGWAGPANRWTHPGRPASGAGVGASFLDGLIRIDVARGIFPREGFRSDLYLDARF